MAVYELTTVKQKESNPYALKRWNNVYHVNATSRADAGLLAPGIIDLEKAIYPSDVAIVRWSVRNPLVRGDTESRTVFVAGTRRAADPNTQLPLFNTVLARLRVETGRPSLKYFRLPLHEDEVTAGRITTDTYDGISGFLTALVALAEITDEDGQVVNGSEVALDVQMRQLGWHRRKRVGFHRGWVAD